MDDLLDRRDFLLNAGALAAGAAMTGWLREAGRGAGSRVRALAEATRGPVLVPGSGAYEGARRVVNSRYDDVRPLAILQAAGAGDVQAAVRWARRFDVPIVARSGGHGYAGYSTTRGLVVDLSRMRGLTLDRADRAVEIGAGARLIDVHLALDPRGVAIPTGSCPTVGVAGLTLGGGVGFASRLMGTTSDNLLALTMVTADGRVVRADARRNADLLWACRGGGGGNFGIVTSLRLRVRPVGRAAYFFASFPFDAADVVVPRWLTWASSAPDALFSICTLSTGGSPTLGVIGQFLGPESRLRGLLNGLTQIQAPTSLSVDSDDYLDVQRRWAGCSGGPVAACRVTPHLSFAAKSDYIARSLSARGADAMAGAIRSRQAAGGSGALILDSYGGAINRVASDATAFVHRDALCSIQYYGQWSSPSAAAGSLAWLRSARAAMRPFVSGFAYQNYVDPELRDFRRAWYGANLPRLREVKRRWDPDRLFDFPQAI